ncbi:hypothetical protein H257_03390 [Aphanomyces astaci]|uniref:Uncharacterized protein n=1 Tax=Aphanomyces astaci TaxID=112090 RepID=W4GYN7_APHAT|nr:hypothetical protein H257_03390 [Aphanomyces astaci]ETV84038.1 hypothetical protein H257_03390 [Aphanomyces astaci]|eukprot:XP_009825730.1 hypothetical protein H257_03390 [Aphanomyces astaci]
MSSCARIVPCAALRGRYGAAAASDLRPRPARPTSSRCGSRTGGCFGSVHASTLRPPRARALAAASRPPCASLTEATATRPPGHTPQPVAECFRPWCWCVQNSPLRPKARLRPSCVRVWWPYLVGSCRRACDRRSRPRLARGDTARLRCDHQPMPRGEVSRSCATTTSIAMASDQRRRRCATWSGDTWYG